MAANTIIYRLEKGSALTYQELDDNFRYLDETKGTGSGDGGATFDTDKDTGMDPEVSEDDDVLRFFVGNSIPGYSNVQNIMTLAANGLTVNMGQSNQAGSTVDGAPIILQAGSGANVVFHADTKGGDIELRPGNYNTYANTDGANTSTPSREGVVRVIGPNVDGPGVARFFDTDRNQFVGISGPDNLDTSYTIKLPPEIGSVGQALILQNTSGNTTWGNTGSSGGPAPATNAYTTFTVSGQDTLYAANGDSSLAFVGSNGINIFTAPSSNTITFERGAIRTLENLTLEREINAGVFDSDSLISTITPSLELYRDSGTSSVGSSQMNTGLIFAANDTSGTKKWYAQLYAAINNNGSQFNSKFDFQIIGHGSSRSSLVIGGGKNISDSAYRTNRGPGSLQVGGPTTTLTGAPDGDTGLGSINVDYGGKGTGSGAGYYHEATKIEVGGTYSGSIEGTTNAVGQVQYNKGTAFIDFTNSKPDQFGGAELYWMEDANRLGINQSSPAYTLDVTGDINFTGTLTNSGTPFSSESNTFSTIAVAGQDSVFAETDDDTLTFVAGSNMTITTDAATDTITFAASGGGGTGDISANGTTSFAYAANTEVTIWTSNNQIMGTPAFKFDYSANTLTVNGHIQATTKSFLIKHPTKEHYMLQYASLEGPENGVYVRGKSSQNVIELPEYWVNLIDEKTITVELTPNGFYQELFVKEINNNRVYVSNNKSDSLRYFYHVYAERKDVPKLKTEYEVALKWQ